jgi:hypothetical protein
MILRRDVVLAASVVLSACQCGGARLIGVPDQCEVDPASCDAGVIEPDAGQPACTDHGTITGRVCAPDLMTFLNGATVSVDAIDCTGASVHLTATTSADGSFTLTNVPPGTSLVVHATLGAFSQDTPVSVAANATTAIPDNQLCVAQKAVRIAVVTGSGDKIENLLDLLHLQYTRYGGDSSTWTTQAEPFLADLTQMKQYDLIFVDCAAAHTSSTIDLGSSHAAISANLHQYVLAGGSVYASDWALLFALEAAPSALVYPTNNGQVLGNPLDTKELMGFAPQTLNASVPDAALAQFLGKSSLSIAFPKQSGANSLHWGLLSAAPGAEVLVSANTVQACKDTTCAMSGSTLTNVPLAVRVRLLPAGQKGGNVVYTSFHNIAQNGTDVQQVLKYLVLNL